MQNLNSNHKEEIKERSELFIPAGKSKTSFIDTRDIAKAAAITLVEETYRNQSITLTPKEFANVMMFLYLMTKLGTAKSITDDLEKVIGTEPISFERYVIDHKEYWM